DVNSSGSGVGREPSSVDSKSGSDLIMFGYTACAWRLSVFASLALYVRVYV
ncbi:unnamed protein product, partial [Ceratitis capitata]